MLQLDPKYKPLLLEALEDLMYKISMEQEKLKGQSMNKQRKELNKKQEAAEELQHLVSLA
jgi:hypothetical protein